jgi:hypothetical protein
MTENDKTIYAKPKSERSERVPSTYASQAEAQQVGSIGAEETKLIRARQDSRSWVLGIILFGMCVLFFAITVVKIGFLS